MKSKCPECGREDKHDATCSRKPGARKKPGDYVRKSGARLHVVVTEEQSAQIQAFADADKVSLSEWCRDAILARVRERVAEEK